MQTPRPQRHLDLAGEPPRTVPESPHSGRRWLVAVLFFLWLAFVLSSYYLVQNAFLQPVLQRIDAIQRWLPARFAAGNLVGALLDVGTAFWIWFAALGSGIVLLRQLPGVRFFSSAQNFVLGSALGYGFLGLTILLLGSIGLFSRLVFLILLLTTSIVGGRSALNLVKHFTRPRPSRLLAAFLIAAFGLALTQALLPPTSWDGLFYHLTGPKLYLENGSLVPSVEIPHLNFPALSEMLFSLALGIRSDVAAVLVHFSFAVLLVALVHLLTADLFRVRNAWWAVVFLLAMPMVLSLGSWAYNDLALAFYSVLALYAMVKSFAHDGTKASPWLVLSGLMAGLAMGFKYTSFVTPLALAGILLWQRRKTVSVAAKSAALFAAVSLLLLAPWLLKNVAYAGNPVYPFIFGGRNWDSFRAAAYAEAGTGIAYDPENCTRLATDPVLGQHVTGCRLDLAHLARRLSTLPLDVTLGIRDASRDGFMGPLFLLFFPILLIYGLAYKGNEASWLLRVFLCFAAVHALFWTAGVMSSSALWQSRLLLPALVALSPVLAWIMQDIERLDLPKVSVSGLLTLVMALVLGIGLLVQLVNWLPQRPWLYLTGNETRTEFLQRSLGAHFLAMESVNRQVPVDGIVLFLWEPRSYYCRRDCRPDSILDNFAHLQYLHNDATEMAHALNEQGITHILVFQSGLDFILEALAVDDQPLDEPAELAALRRDHLRLVESVENGAYELYRLTLQD